MIFVNSVCILLCDVCLPYFALAENVVETGETSEETVQSQCGRVVHTLM